jgi:tetratricopeptide (TPR) repeat protein
MAGNFDERHGRAQEARRLYERFAGEERAAELVSAGLERVARGTVPPPIVASARDGAAEALFDLASVFNQRQTLETALVYARLALDLRPDLGLAQLLLAEIQEDQHHTEEALAIYRSVGSGSPLAWTARLRAALALDQLGRTDEAVALLRQMAADQPKRQEALASLGDILRGHNRFDEAVTAYDDALGRTGTAEAKQWRLLYSRGVALERSGQWPRAEADLRRALELQPDQPLVLNYLGYSWIDRGENLKEALKMIERAVELRPNDGYIVDSLGWAFYRLGEYPKAATYLERAIELLPEDPTINDHLGDVYWQTGRVAEARFQWRRALQFKPEADQVKSIEGKIDRGLAKEPAAASARGG